MVIDYKISCTIAIPGNSLDAQSLQLKTVEKTKLITLKNGKKFKKHFKEQIEDWSNADMHSFTTKDSKTKEVKTLYYATQKRLPAHQHINICREAYNYYVSNESCPENMSPSMWKQTSKKNKVRKHCELIAESLGGKLVDFYVFED